VTIGADGDAMPVATAQYRVISDLRVNVREEGAADSRVLCQLSHGTILQADPWRTLDGEFLPVVVRGWVHRAYLELIE
jgi:hypothetical protein